MQGHTVRGQDMDTLSDQIKRWKHGGNFTYSMSGRGMMEGNNLYMDSTRAEARGLLATINDSDPIFTRVIPKGKTD